MIPSCLSVFFSGDISVVHFKSRMRFGYSFPRYQKRGSFSRITVYEPSVRPVMYCPEVRIKSECCCVRIFYNNVETSVIREEADI